MSDTPTNPGNGSHDHPRLTRQQRRAAERRAWKQARQRESANAVTTGFAPVHNLSYAMGRFVTSTWKLLVPPWAEVPDEYRIFRFYVAERSLLTDDDAFGPLMQCDADGALQNVPALVSTCEDPVIACVMFRRCFGSIRARMVTVYRGGEYVTEFSPLDHIDGLPMTGDPQPLPWAVEHRITEVWNVVGVPGAFHWGGAA